MQSATNDVNGAIVGYRQMLLYGISNRNTHTTRTAISILNGILPDRLKLRFDTRAYDESRADVPIITCPDCGTEMVVEAEKIKHRQATPSLGWGDMVAGPPVVERYLDCEGAECGKRVVVEEDRIDVIARRDYDRDASGTDPVDEIVYAPAEPELRSLQDEMLNDVRYWEWVRIVTSLLEDRMRAYRDSVGAAPEEGEMLAT